MIDLTKPVAVMCLSGGTGGMEQCLQQICRNCLPCRMKSKRQITNRVV